MRALSFIPAATRTIYDLGLDAQLHGVTFECASDKPKVVRSRLEGLSLDSAQIDRAVGEAAARGEMLHYVDRELLERIAPDVIFTQQVCGMCQIGADDVERAVARLPHPPTLVSLVPRRLADERDNVGTIAHELARPDASRALVQACDARIAVVVDALRAARAKVCRVMVMEWLDPIYNCGHWIPDQIALAGGADALSCPAGYSTPVPWERVRLYDPEVLVIAPCGFDVKRSMRELGGLSAREGFAELSAVRAGRVFVADAELFTQPSLTTLVEGVELLAHLFHPELLRPPEGFATRCAPLPSSTLAP